MLFFTISHLVGLCGIGSRQETDKSRTGILHIPAHDTFVMFSGIWQFVMACDAWIGAMFDK